MSRRNLNYLGWALTGGALGALLGVLAAPYTGRETRRRIARTISERKAALIRRGHQAREGVAGYLRAS